MTEESHREEMNAAIRAQRERGAAPSSLLHGSMLPPEDEQAAPPAAPEQPPEVEPGSRTGLLSRLLRRGRP